MKKTLHQNHDFYYRLASYSAAAGAIVTLVPNVSGQVQYSGIQDIEIDNLEVFNLDMDGDATTDFVFIVGGHSSTGTTSYSMFYYGVIINPVSGSYANSWIFEYTGVHPVVAGLNDASVIDSGWTTWTNYIYAYWNGALGVYSTNFGVLNTYGNFLGQEKYIGVRFHHGPSFHYGWIRAYMELDAKKLILHDWAYEITPDGGITAEDIWRPIPILTPGVPARTNIQNIPVAVRFDEPIQGLTIGDFSISNGNVTDLIPVTPGLEYTLMVSASAYGTVNVTLPAGTVTDNSLNDNVEATTSWFYDNIVPAVTLDLTYPGVTNEEIQIVEITFSEDVLDLELADFNVTNGTKGSLVTVVANREYTLEVTASAEGAVTIELPAGSVTDGAGNQNAAASVIYTYDSGNAVDELFDAVVSFYPNPANDFITVELKHEATITITYITGKIALVKEHIMKEVIDISGLPEGIYLMHVETANGFTIRKFVIE